MTYAKSQGMFVAEPRCICVFDIWLNSLPTLVNISKTFSCISDLRHHSHNISPNSTVVDLCYSQPPGNLYSEIRKGIERGSMVSFGTENVTCRVGN